MASIRWVLKIMILLMCLSDVYTFFYSTFNATYIEARETMMKGEMENIQKKMPDNIEQVGSFTMRRSITRIVNARYQYGLTQPSMEEICKKIMEENEWRFVEKKVYRKIKREELIFKKEGYECQIDFFKEHEFRISLVTDDIYHDLNW